jgi:hypothetical protein
MVRGGRSAYNGGKRVREKVMNGRWMMVCFVLAAATGPAHADMYTWVDKDGTTNVSNVPPPEDVRVTKVARTAPKDPAREAAARQAEMRALRDRVDELSKEVEQSRTAGIPPPDAPAPVLAYAPPAAPAPTVVVTVVNQPAQAAQPEYAPSGCDYTLGGCGAFFPGYVYYAPPFQRGFHKPQHHRNRATPTRQTYWTPQPLIPPLIPHPVKSPASSRRLG